MDLSEIWSKIRNDSKSTTKIGTIIAIYVLITFLSFLIQILTSFSGIAAPFFSEEGYVLFQLYLTFGLLPTIQLILLPVNLYLHGYQYSIVEENSLPSHNFIWKRIKLGFIYFSSSLAINLIYGLLGIIVVGMIIIFAGALFEAMNLVLGTLLIISVVTFIFFFIILFTLINNVVIPSMMFVYLKKRQFTKIFDLEELRNVLRLIWKDLLIIIFINYALNAIMGIVGFVLCFLGPLTIGLVQAAKLILNGLLLSQVYRKIK